MIFLLVLCAFLSGAVIGGCAVWIFMTIVYLGCDEAPEPVICIWKCKRKVAA